MSITLPALSILQNANADNALSSLFSIINGQAAGTATTDPVSALLNAEKNGIKEVARQSKVRETKRDVDRFLAAVAKATDLKSLLQDPTARKVLLTANGLGNQSDYVALATKALSSDTTAAANLASRLSDKRWLTMAKTYDFANKGLTVLKQSLSTIASGYAEVKWRESLDASTPGLSAALDFRSRASTIKSAVQILGDTNLRKVVTTALGLPLEIAYQSLAAQEKAITSRLDLTKFSDPKFVEQFTRRFLVANQTSDSAISGIYA